MMLRFRMQKSLLERKGEGKLSAWGRTQNWIKLKLSGLCVDPLKGSLWCFSTNKKVTEKVGFQSGLGWFRRSGSPSNSSSSLTSPPMVRSLHTLQLSIFPKKCSQSLPRDRGDQASSSRGYSALLKSPNSEIVRIQESCQEAQQIQQ